MLKTAIIILNYNNSQDTRNCIESILRYNTAEVKYIIVDNDSSPKEQESLRSVLSKLFDDDYLKLTANDPAPHSLPLATLIETCENLGYARGNNTGLELAYNDDEINDVMILNNDVLFVEDIIPALLEKKQQIDDCAIISPLLYKKGLKEYDFNCARFNVKVSSLIKNNFTHYIKKLINYQPHPSDKAILMNVPSSVDCIEIELPSGSCMLFDKNYFKSIGSFDPNTFLYFEENILYKKISSTNRKNYLLLNLKCIHLGASTTSNIQDNKWLVTQARNSEKYYVRNYTSANAFVKALHSLSVKFFMTMYSLQKFLKK